MQVLKHICIAQCLGNAHSLQVGSDAAQSSMCAVDRSVMTAEVSLASLTLQAADFVVVALT